MPCKRVEERGVSLHLCRWSGAAPTISTFSCDILDAFLEVPSDCR